VRLSLVRERAEEPYRVARSVRCGADVVQLLQRFLGDDPRETFACVYLDGRNQTLAIHACSVGTAGSAPVHPREVFGPALLCSASALIVAHNHPSGDATPSPEDRQITERLRQVGELLGVELLDHVVIGEGRFYSFADERCHPIGGRADG